MACRAIENEKLRGKKSLDKIQKLTETDNCVLSAIENNARTKNCLRKDFPYQL